MAKLKLILDTSIVIDCLDEREPFYQDARLLLTAGRVGEFELWLTSSQFTDLIYILSNGGKRKLLPSVLNQLQGLVTFINIFPVSEREISLMLATQWNDPEDALLYESALAIQADFIVTRNQADFEGNLVKAVNCEELFEWLEKKYGISYAEVAI